MRKLATQVIHEGYKPEPLAGCVAPPIYMSTTYAQKNVGEHNGYEYARSNNPTREMLEKNISALEGAVGATAYSTGMAAISCLLLNLGQNSHVLASANVYGGTYRVFQKIFTNLGLEFDFVPSASAQEMKPYFKENTKLVFIETPTNPLMEISPIQDICDLAHENGAKVCVDNTFLTPILQRPINHGADYVIHSATKYLGGHSDVLGGILCCADGKDHEQNKFSQKSVGAVLSPFDSWLILRGIKTLALRMKAHQNNATKVAQFMQEHSLIRKVYYPGLEDHKGYDINASQTDGPGGMLAFELSNPDKVDEFLASLDVFTLAESLGAVESLVCVPAKMTHASIPREERRKVGIEDSLIRLSIGIEDADDLLEDLDRALHKIST
ncbi:MAG: PLP-dependent aspartate aminotransferase family protein [bacterium]|nr:PLP-dependent aspartate aminotransferase family protein [bacterium]